jgi:hypothetical protein
MGVASVMGENVQALAAVRESVVEALSPAPAGTARIDQLARWERNAAAAHLYDQAHALFLWGESGGEPFAAVRGQLEETFPQYAPFRFLEREDQSRLAETPRPIASEDFPVATASGGHRVLQVAAVTMRIGDSRAVVMFVDNDKREIYGQRYFDGDAAELDRRVERFAAETLRDLRTAYDGLAAAGSGGGSVSPPEGATAAHLRDRVAVAVAVANRANP